MKRLPRRSRPASQAPRRPAHSSPSPRPPARSAGDFAQPLRVLLATDLSHTNTRPEAALRQLARACPVEADVVHVIPPQYRSRDVLEQLSLLAAGVGNAAVTRRVVACDGAAAAIASLCARNAYDLVMIPTAGSRWRVTWEDSARAAVLRHGCAPLWTGGGRLDPSWFDRPIRRVGCHVSLEPGRDVHLRASAELASRLGASLHVLHVVPPIDDGIIADAFESRRPLTSEAARASLEGLLAPGLAATTTVAVGARPRELRRWLRTQAVDVLCVGPDEAMWGNRMSPALRALPCPVVCLGGAPTPTPGAARWRTSPPSAWPLAPTTTATPTASNPP